MVRKTLCLVLTVALLGWAQAATAQITGTVHDLSNKSWNLENKLCDVCHMTHDAKKAVAIDAPLWSREDTVATFTTYSRFTLDATVGQPDGNSKLCLSCHDGTVALQQFGGTHGRYTTSNYTTWGKLGTDLSDDHPVSFVYDTALATADGELADPATAVSGLGGTIDEDMLFAGKVQCSSCHDVHVKNGSYMTKEIAHGELCLTCHLK